MKVNKTELLNGIMIDYNINKTNGIKYVPMLPPPSYPPSSSSSKLQSLLMFKVPGCSSPP